MAVTLPLLILGYELIFHSGAWRAGGWAAVRRAMPLLAVGILTLLYVHARTAGPGAMTRMEAYRPVFTLGRFHEANVRFLSEIFYADGVFTPAALWALWLFLAGVALLKRDRPLGLAVWWVILTPLPIALILNRGAGSLYIVLVGWAMIVSLLFVRLASYTAQRLAARGLSAAAGKTVLATAAVSLAFWGTYHHHVRDMPGWLVNGDQAWDAIQQLRGLQVQPRPGSRVVLLDDPFGNYDLLFMAELLWRDPSLRINLQSRDPLGPEELAKADYVVAAQAGRFVLTRRLGEDTGERPPP
jgi:hypothetical protein